MINIKSILAFSILGLFVSCLQANHTAVQDTSEVQSTQEVDYSDYSNAYFASGCFWCSEAVFESVIGVKEAISGYSGGIAVDATYQRIGTGRTGHAEALRVIYDSTKVTYDVLLKVLFGSHDPTTLNRQGPDRGPQYRSAVFYQTEIEKKKTLDYIDYLDNSDVFKNKIVTQVVPLEKFYPAEDYHQNYERLHPNNSYVKAVSIPRLNKFKKKFPELLKENQSIKK